MLRWQQTPDQVFTAIVTAALEVSIDQLSDACGEIDDECVAGFSSDVVGVFTPRELLVELRKLLDAHRSSKLWMPTDYHFLLLYRALEHQIQFHNEAFHDSPCLMRFGDFIVGAIDFECLCDSYFWDLDFLIASEEFDGMAPEAKASLGFSDESFGVVHGMKPHSDELQLKIHETGESEPLSSECYQPGLEYPFFEELSSTELTVGAQLIIAVVAHWEPAVTAAVALLPSSLRDRITVRESGGLVVVDDVNIRLHYSIREGQLEAGGGEWLLGETAEEHADVVRSAAADSLFSELADHGFCFRRESYVTPDGVQFHDEDLYTEEYWKRNRDSNDE